MKWYGKIAVFLLLLIVTVNLSAKSSVILTVDNNQLVLGQTTALKVTISDLKVSEPPKIINIDNFKLDFAGTSSNISIINGNYKSEKVFTFMLTPLKKGNFTIGPAIVNINGKIYKSNRIKISVSDNPNQPATNKNKKIFIKVSVNKNEAVLNEEIILSVKIYRRIDVYNMSINLPKISDFIFTRLSDSKQYIDVIDGIQYKINELKYSLFPTETGNFTIPPFILYCTVPVSNNPIDSFFKNPFIVNNAKKISVPSNSLKINIIPLKQNVYGVGDYKFTYSADKSVVKVGDSITLTFKISGMGNLNFSDSLKLPEMNYFEYYPDKPEIKLKKTSEGIFSEKTEKIVIVPEQTGEYEIPELYIKFYNPKNKKYEKYTLPSIPIKVLQSNGNKLKVVENKKNNITKTHKNGIDTIITDFKLENQAVDIDLNKILIIFILPLLLLILCYFLKISYLSRKANYKKILKSNAFSNFKKEISNVENIDRLSQVIRNYFANRTGNFNKAVTFKEIIEIVNEYHVNEDILENLKKLFAEIEQSQFAKFSINIDKLKEDAFNVVKSIDKYLK